MTPSARIQHFASTDDLNEFREFLDDVPATSTWFIPPGVADPRKAESFELLSYSVDGVELPIRHSLRKHGQSYTVELGAEILLSKQPVRIRHVYRTVAPRIGHRFRIALTQPTHGMRLVMDYSDTDIAELKVGDLPAPLADIVFSSWKPDTWSGRIVTSSKTPPEPSRSTCSRGR